MKKKTLTLISSCAAIAVCSSLIVGSTYALFTSEDKVDIAVTAGKVAVTAEVVDSSLETYSMGNKQETGKFENGGTAGFTSTKKLELNYVTPGDKATFEIKITNESTVNVKYRVNWTVEGTLGDVLVASADNVAIGAWAEWKATDTVKEKTVSLSVELPENVGNEYQAKDEDDVTTISFVVEAIQGNAEVVKEVRVADLKDYFPNAKLASNDTAAEATVLKPADGEALIVENWQDIWVNGSLTIEGITFEKGLSLTNNNADYKKLTVKDCVFYPCEQELLRKKVEANLIKEGTDSNYRIDNSGDGLCLGLDSAYENYDVEVKGCVMYGDGGEDVNRDGYKNAAYMLANNKDKARGHAVCMGLAAGVMQAKTVTIDGCEMYNIRGNAVQIYSCNYSIVIKNNLIESWGQNNQNLVQYIKDDSAIRGNIGSNASVTLIDNTFGMDEDASHFHVNIDNFDGNTDGTRLAGKY